MKNQSIVFCGLSKNNKNTLVQNVEFINEFQELFSKEDIHLLVIDTDSNDGSKEYIKKMCNSKIHMLNMDNIDKKYKSRVQRIQVCRNKGLDFIDENFNNRSVIYVPCDFDINLFSQTSYSQMKTFIEYISMEEIDAIFPVSQPFYYDIFALRSKGWVDYNAVFFAHRLKKFFKIGSFIWNYLYIFRYQKSINKINNKPIKVTSAFGGIGIYDLSKIDINTSRYMVDSENTDWFSEHLYFNSYFNNLEIRTDWVIDAPNQHIEFKSFSIIHKFLYILRTLKFDFHSILQKEDEDPK